MISRKLKILCFLAGFGMIAPASAQLVELERMNKVPRYSSLTQQEFEEKTGLFTEIPQGDAFLEYEIRLPGGWVKLGDDGEAIVSEDEKKEESMQAAPTAEDPYGLLSLRDEQIESEKKAAVSEEDEEAMRKYKKRVQRETQDYSAENLKSKKMERERRAENLNTSLLGPVAKYVGPTSAYVTSRLEIYAMQLTQGMTTRNWFLNYILGRNYTLMGMEQVTKNRVDAEYVLLDNGVSYVVRTAAISNGDRMVLISYYVPEKKWEAEKALQEDCLDSFRFLNPEKDRTDDRQIYGFLDFVKFSYPGTWRLIAPNIDSIENMKVKLIYTVDSQTLDGEIDVSIISTELDTTLMKEVDYLREDLEERGFKIGENLPVNDAYTFDRSITFNRIEAYSIENDEKSYIDYEYWLGIMVEDRYYYFVTMVTPGRKADFYTWARNTEAFSMIVQSMMPQVAGEALDVTFIQNESDRKKRGKENE
ncbi:MAG: hypothetical protein ACK4NR_08350 [Micavibrio sp.]